MARRNWYSGEINNLLRQTVSAWVILFGGVLAFTSISLLLFNLTENTSLIVVISFVATGIPTILAHIYLKKIDYHLSLLRTRKPSKSQRALISFNPKRVSGDLVFGNISIGKSRINVGSVSLSSTIQESFNKLELAGISDELKETLKQLAQAVEVMIKDLPVEQAEEVSDDLTKLIDEAIKNSPKKKWYVVSVDGLVKVAENLGKVGEPVIKLSRKVLSILNDS